MSGTNNWINWIEERNIRCYEHNEFSDVREISVGSLGTVYFANRNSGTKSYALKSININDVVIDELIDEVITI